MRDPNKFLIIFAVYLGISCAFTGFRMYKSSRLSALYGQAYNKSFLGIVREYCDTDDIFPSYFILKEDREEREKAIEETLIEEPQVDLDADRT